MKRSATAVWNGTVKEGQGKLTTQSNTLKQTPYSYTSRFEDGSGTNPEELIAAAHAGCFAMALSMILGKAGFTPDRLEAVSTVTMDAEKLQITHSHIHLKAKVPDISEGQFKTCAEDAKANCPVSKALNMALSLEATLE